MAKAAVKPRPPMRVVGGAATPPTGDLALGFEAIRPGLEALFRAHRAAAHAISELNSRLEALLQQAQDNGNRASELIAIYRRGRDVTEGAEGDPRVPPGLDTLLKEFCARLDRLKYELLPEAFAREGTSVLTIVGGDRVTVSEEVLASILKEDRPVVYDWFRRHGHGDLIIETVNASTLSAWVKAELEENREPPEQVKVTIRQRANLTRGKGK